MCARMETEPNCIWISIFVFFEDLSSNEVMPLIFTYPEGACQEPRHGFGSDLIRWINVLSLPRWSRHCTDMDCIMKGKMDIL